MKKLLAILLAFTLVLSLAGCSGNAAEGDSQDVIELTLWTYPAGDWGDKAAVETLLTQFNSVYPNIQVTVQCLSEANGDNAVSSAVDGGLTPDLLLAGVEQLMGDWGAQGLLADLSDMWDDRDKTEINDVCQSGCFTTDGKCYM